MISEPRWSTVVNLCELRMLQILPNSLKMQKPQLVMKSCINLFEPNNSHCSMPYTKYDKFKGPSWAGSCCYVYVYICFQGIILMNPQNHAVTAENESKLTQFPHSIIISNTMDTTCRLLYWKFLFISKTCMYLAWTKVGVVEEEVYFVDVHSYLLYTYSNIAHRGCWLALVEGFASKLMVKSAIYPRSSTSTVLITSICYSVLS